MEYCCKHCELSIRSENFLMVMVNDKLWGDISDDWKDLICHKCIEKRMGRPIVESDFKSEQIPCNEDFLKETTGQYSEGFQKEFKKNFPDKLHLL